jgi:hypothetical protein
MLLGSEELTRLRAAVLTGCIFNLEFNAVGQNPSMDEPDHANELQRVPRISLVSVAKRVKGRVITEAQGCATAPWCQKLSNPAFIRRIKCTQVRVWHY